MPLWAFRAASFVVVGVGAGTLLVGVPAYSRTPYIPTGPVPVPEAADVGTTVADPLRLRIPALSVDAHVQPVGVGKGGNMAVPQGVSQYRDVAWYRSGARPGEAGNAVIAGHLDGAFGLPAVFSNLGVLTLGDSIEVVDAQGVTRHFVVAAKEEFPVDEIPNERIFGGAPGPRLNLITCAGTWDSGTKAYDRRLVVYAVGK